MGVRNLYKLIKKYAPESITTRPLSHYHGKVIGVDASINIYQWCSVGVSRNIVNTDGKYINHIQGMFFRVIKMRSAGITPVYIFDGKPPPAKRATIAARRNSRAVSGHKSPGTGVFKECIKLLHLMGIPCVQSLSEAESHAALLNSIGVIDAVATEDSDAIVFGARTVLMGLNAAGGVRELDVALMLQILGISHSQLVDMCLLLGTDYNEKMPGVGISNAYKLIKKYGNIENVLQSLGIDDFNYSSAKQEFLHPRVGNAVEVRPVLMPPDYTKLEDFLLQHGLDKTRVNNGIKKLKLHM